MSGRREGGSRDGPRPGKSRTVDDPNSSRARAGGGGASGAAHHFYTLGSGAASSSTSRLDEIASRWATGSGSASVGASAAAAGGAGSTVMRSLGPYQPTVTTGLLPGVGRAFMNASPYAGAGGGLPVASSSASAAAGPSTAAQAPNPAYTNLLTPPDNLLRRQEAREKRAKAKQKKAAAAVVAAAALMGNPAASSSSSSLVPHTSSGSAAGPSRAPMTRRRSSQSMHSDASGAAAAGSGASSSRANPEREERRRRNRNRGERERAGSARTSTDVPRRGSAASASAGGRSDASRPLSRANSRGSSHYAADAEAAGDDADEPDADDVAGGHPGDQTLRPPAVSSSRRAQIAAEASAARAQQASLRRRNLWEDVEGMELPDPDDLPPPFPAGSTRPPSPPRADAAPPASASAPGAGASAAPPTPSSPPPEFHSDPESDDALHPDSRPQTARTAGAARADADREIPPSPAPRPPPAAEDEDSGAESEAGSAGSGADAEGDGSGSEASLSLMTPERQAWEEDRRAGLSLFERLARESHRQSQRISVFLSGRAEQPAAAQQEPARAAAPSPAPSNASAAGSDALSVLLAGPPHSASSGASFPVSVTAETPLPGGSARLSDTASIGPHMQVTAERGEPDSQLPAASAAAPVPLVHVQQPSTASDSQRSGQTASDATINAADAGQSSAAPATGSAEAGAAPPAARAAPLVIGPGQGPDTSRDVEAPAPAAAAAAAGAQPVIIGPGQGPDTSMDDAERDRYRRDVPPIRTSAAAPAPVAAAPPAPRADAAARQAEGTEPTPTTAPSPFLRPGEVQRPLAAAPQAGQSVLWTQPRASQQQEAAQPQTQAGARKRRPVSSEGLSPALRIEPRIDDRRALASVSPGPSQSAHRRTQSTSQANPTLPSAHAPPTRMRQRPQSASETKYRDDATAAAERRSKLWGDRPLLRVIPPAFRPKQPIVLSDGGVSSSDDEFQDAVAGPSISRAEDKQEADAAEKEESSDSDAALESDSSDDVWEAEMEAIEAIKSAQRPPSVRAESSSSNGSPVQRDRPSHARDMSDPLKDLQREVPKAPPPLVLGRSRGGAAYSSSSESSSDDDVASDSSDSVAGAHETSSRSDPPAAEAPETGETQDGALSRSSSARSAPKPLQPLFAHSRLKLPSLESAKLPPGQHTEATTRGSTEDEAREAPSLPPRPNLKGKQREVVQDRMVPADIRRAAEALQLTGNEFGQPQRAGTFEEDSSSSQDFSADDQSASRQAPALPPRISEPPKRRPPPSPPTTSSTKRSSVSNRLNALFEPHVNAVPLGPSALALSRASADARADFLKRTNSTRWQERSAAMPATPAPSLGPWSQAGLAQAPSPLPDVSARSSLLDDIARARAVNAASYRPLSGTSAQDSLSSLERLLTIAGGSGISTASTIAERPLAREESSEAGPSSPPSAAPALPPRPPADRRLSRSNAVTERVGRPVSFVNKRSTIAPMPKEGRLPTITDATRHFPPTSPATPSWLAYISPEERASLQQPLHPDQASSRKENRRVAAILPGQAGSRVSALVSQWENSVAAIEHGQAASWKPSVSPRTDAMQKLMGQHDRAADPGVVWPHEGRQDGTKTNDTSDFLLPSPAPQSARLSGASTLDGILEGYNRSRTSMASSTSGRSAVVDPSPSVVTASSAGIMPPSASPGLANLPSAERRDFAAVIQAGRMASNSRQIAIDEAENSAGGLPSSVLERATLVAVTDRDESSDGIPDLPTAGNTNAGGPIAQDPQGREECDASDAADEIGRAMITWQRSLRLRNGPAASRRERANQTSTRDTTEADAAVRTQNAGTAQNGSLRRALPPVPGAPATEPGLPAALPPVAPLRLASSRAPRRPLPQPPVVGSQQPPSEGAESPAAGSSRNVSESSNQAGAFDPIAAPDARIHDSEPDAAASDAAGMPETAAPEERAVPAARRAPSLGITDLDILASRLEQEGDHYEALAALGEFLGPAIETRASADEISELPVAKVELISRRTTKEGKIKQKLGVAGVRVDRCTICQMQFRPDQMACIFPCLHIFHDSCASRLLKTVRTCPQCRHDIAEPFSPTRETEGIV